MKFVKWEVLPEVFLPMMEDDNGELFCTNKAICDGLDINEIALRSVYRRHPEEFSKNCVAICNAKEFLQQSRDDFGIKYVRSDMRLRNEDDMLTFAFHAKSDKCLEFRKKLRQFIKENARRHYVTQEQYSELSATVGTLLRIVMCAAPVVDGQASMAGKLLNSHKLTKQLRGMLN